jgi:hypothetical protein
MPPLVLDPDVVAAALARHLLDGTSRIESCRVVRYRHRPADRSLVQYLARVRDAQGRISEERVTGQWHATRERTAAIFRRVERRAAAGTAMWTRGFAPVFFDEPLGMLATTFPFDRRLPALHAVASAAAPALVSAMLNAMGADGAQLTSVDVATVRYREQLNAVCRYRLVALVNGLEEEAVFFAKAYADDGGQRMYGVMHALAAATLRPGTHARVRAPIAYDAALRTLVVAGAAGMPLDTLHRLESPYLDANLTRLAAALADFGRCEAALPGGPGGRSMIHAIDRAALAISRGHPALAQGARMLRQRIAAALTPRRVGLVHGDLKLEHMFLEGNDVWLIDVDSAHEGDPLWDLALLQARWWAACDATGSTHTTGDRGWAILEATYLARVPPDWKAHLVPLQAAALIDVAAGVIKRQEPDWQARAARLVARALRAGQGAS